MNTQGKDIIERGKDVVGGVAHALGEARELTAEEMRAELGRLRGQVESLVGDMARTGKRQLRKAQHGAVEGMEVMSRKGGEMIGEVSHELHGLEDRTAEAIRARPLQSVGIAIGFGFLLAVVLRR